MLFVFASIKNVHSSTENNSRININVSVGENYVIEDYFVIALQLIGEISRFDY